MSRTYRRTEDGRLRPEIDMPERERLNPPADFPPYSVCIMEPDMGVHLYRTPYFHGPTLRAYVAIERQTHLTCGHLNEWADRFGYVHCTQCGAEVWSPYWVADGVFGLASAMDPEALDETGLWIERTEKEWIERVMTP